MKLGNIILWGIVGYLSLWALVIGVWAAAVVTCRIRRWRDAP